MLIITEVKVDLEKPPMLDVDHHGGQSGPGDHPLTHWTFIVTESGCSGRTSATLDVHRHGVRVLQENLITSDVHRHGVRMLRENLRHVGCSLSWSQGAPGEPRHVGRSSSWSQGAPGEPRHVGRSSSRSTRCSGRTSPRRTFIVMESGCSRRTSATLDVHCHGVGMLRENLRHVGCSSSWSQGAPGEPHHVGRSSSWSRDAPGEPPPRWMFIVMESGCSGRTSATLDVHRHGVRVLQENLATPDVHCHGLQGAPGEPRHVGHSSSWSQGAPGEPHHVGRSSSRTSRCSGRTPPRWTFLVTEIKVLWENLRHVGRSSSRRSGCSWTLGSLAWTLGCPPHPLGTLGFLTSPHPVWLR
ncbi:branched-chain alpha-ketoacid dehydrogenase kinase isoform X2 [Haliaeetus albicilla]|uniref:branched-chain alpha-ketoacid dehydrogenase kinase isoform X2 n=1 Tax=Haliaeetus albicilla TaxID=8969 RepID=UPI0037E7CCB5